MTVVDEIRANLLNYLDAIHRGIRTEELYCRFIPPHLYLTFNMSTDTTFDCIVPVFGIEPSIELVFEYVHHVRITYPKIAVFKIDISSDVTSFSEILHNYYRRGYFDFPSIFRRRFQLFSYTGNLNLINTVIMSKTFAPGERYIFLDFLQYHNPGYFTKITKENLT